MRTYTHGAIGYLLYHKGTKSQQNLAIIGAMTPDAILDIGFIFHFTPESSITTTLHNLFHHSQLHNLTLLMHSFTLIIPLVILSKYKYPKLTPFIIGALSHAIIDLLTHQQWGYNHFYPIALPQFSSPISYMSTPFTIIEHIFFIAILIYYFKHKRHHTS